MLLTEEGWAAGSISGGCLEGDVLQFAWERTTVGPALVTYDSTADQDIVWGFGLGCSGVVRVLLERLPEDGGLLAYLANCFDARRPALVATAIGEGSELGKRRLDIGSDDPLYCELLRIGEGSRTAHVDGVEMLLEHIPPPRPIVIFGAGHDAGPLVAAAKGIGWHVTVVDGRPSYVRRDRFPDADALVLAGPEEAVGRVVIDAQTSVVIMNHNFLHDLAILRGVLRTSASYVGLLGPRVRSERLLSELEMDHASARLERVHAPIGLDLGAEGPDEIALSIVAEIQAAARGRAAGSLNGRSAPLHDFASR